MRLDGIVDVVKPVSGEQNEHLNVSGNITVQDLEVVVTLAKDVDGAVTQIKHVAGNIAGKDGGDLSDIIVKSGVSTFVELPAGGYYGIGSVTVEGDEDLVPENIKLGVTVLGVVGEYAPEDPKLMSGEATIEANGDYIFRPSEGFVGLSRQKVTVNVPTETVEEVIEAKFQSKTVTPGTESQTITPDEDAGFNALDRVTVEGDRDLKPENIVEGVSIFGVEGSYKKRDLQDKSVTPGKDAKTVKPDEDFEGLSSVYVAGDSDLIPTNIREGVNIFGVEGNYSTGQNYQDKNVTPNGKRITVSADEGYHALSKVTVEGDYKLAPENIADGVTIYGVRGNYVSPMKPITVVPSRDEQHIIPAAGFYGFSAITVAPVDITGEYTDGYDAGVKSRDNEVAVLEDRINDLTEEKNAAYDEGYEDGYEDGAASGGNDDGSFQEGYDQGKQEGYSEGFDQGKQEGYAEGKLDGYSEGYAEGYVDGKSDGAMYNFVAVGYIPTTGKVNTTWNAINKITAIGTLQE